MASVEIKGIVRRIGKTEVVSEKFKKRELVLDIDTETEYPQIISIEAAQDKCEDKNLEEAREGDSVTVSINFRGREWFSPEKNKNLVFNSLQFWKMTIDQTSSGVAKPTYVKPVDLNEPVDGNSLPF